MKYKNILSCLSVTLLLWSCKSGPFNLIKPATPHEQYERKLINAGLDRSAMGAAWLATAQQSLQKALLITVPYQEKGYFAAEKIDAATFRFKLVRGEKLKIALNKKPSDGFKIYIDLWSYQQGQPLKFVATADTLLNQMEVPIAETGDYLLRLQPELLGSGSYELMISKGPSLAAPLKTMKRSQIQSFYGDGRDENARKHEGVDIFAPFRTPVIAAAPGVVTGVNMNNLGGKVVWLRPDQQNFTLYYAHLDEQLVQQGQTVAIGDTLGLMGNTGNAKTTPPHLHFGIYTNNGAIDPFPFINPSQQEVPKINV
ncbi:MAG: M23 family metallopeptidase [Pedobacter sp.]|nr:M23 family metallopeptidase [Pedobacter sp.]MDQ8054350.1 M23 family metallopeptidase [Pedobacter sp.]